MKAPTDLMLVVERDPDALNVLACVAEKLGCDRVEATSLPSVLSILALRRPTIAVLAVDSIEADSLAVLQVLADSSSPPVTFLVGAVDDRVLSGIKRAAQLRGLEIVGTGCRPLNADQLEELFAAHLTAAPPVARAELEQALAVNELTIEYQPKIALASEGLHVQGVEALVRWRHPRKGILYPRHFLDAFEKYELITHLTDFVMTEAVRQAGRWRTTGLNLELVVNLSPALVRDRKFPERLALLLAEYEFPSSQLMLDVTESSSAVDRDLMFDVFTRLRILGVGLSLDNFGTGLSSLTELYRMPYSEIKIDHCLIADVPGEKEAMIIVRAIADLASNLGLAVCAEGVETRQTLDFVRAAGITSAQGRYFSGPVSATEIEQIVRAWPSTGVSATGSWHSMRRADKSLSARNSFQPSHIDASKLEAAR